MFLAKLVEVIRLGIALGLRKKYLLVKMFKFGRNNKYFGIRADITRMSFCNHENLQTLSFRKNYLTVKMELKKGKLPKLEQPEELFSVFSLQ